MKILLIAPHQDDEILAAGGLIQKSIKQGDDFLILFATNGDYHGLDIARKRYYESEHALTSLGLAKKSIFYLGYGDTGMKYSHSFLKRMSLEKNDTLLSSLVSSTTYHSAGMKTVHVMRTGAETSLTRRAFLSDLNWFIVQHSPDIIIISDSSDMHGDHAALIELLQNTDVFNQVPICLTYIIHGGNDSLWPPRDSQKFTCPPVCDSKMWNKRISIPLTNQEQYYKYKAIFSFATQLEGDFDNFLVSFSKQEEIFFLLRDTRINRQKIYSHFEYKENL